MSKPRLIIIGGSMAGEFQFGEAFQEKLLAMYVREPQKVFSVIEPGYFTSPIHADIAKITRQVYENQDREKVRLSKSTLMTLMKGTLGKKRRDVWPGYRQAIRDLYEDRLRDSGVIFQQAVGFAKEQKFRQALIDAERDVNSKNYDRAVSRFEKLKHFGVEVDLGIEYWKEPTNPARWIEDRQGVVGTFYFPKLDNAMGGGLGNGELGIVLAGGKVGKTTILARFAAGALWQGKNVAIATGELSSKKYRKRIDAMVTLTPTWKLAQLGRANDQNSKLMSKLRRVQQRMLMAQGFMKGSLWIKHYPTGKGRVSDIETWLDQLKERGVKIDLLCADYIRTFRPNERYEEQRLSIGQVCMDFRGLAVERDIPVWTAAQTTRGALDKENIGPKDFAEDISQFWTLDFLVAMCQTKAEGKANSARLILTAARDVGHGIVTKVSLDRKTFRVWEPCRNGNSNKGVKL